MLSITKSLRFAVLTTIAASAVVAARGDDAPLSPALKSVQGVWAARDDAQVQAKWIIKGESIHVNVNGEEYKGKVVVDAAAKPHPSLTIEIEDGPGEAKGKSAKGVYKLEGEKLTVNIGAPGQDRPVDFNPYGSDIYLFELTKQKDSK